MEDLENINFRTDLALERRDFVEKNNNANKIDGVDVEKEKINDDITVTRVKIIDENGSAVIGKPKGEYITIDIKKLKIAEDKEIQLAANILTQELRKMIEKNIDKKEDILIVGLGNLNVTPDSLGPKVINEIDVTRHIIKYLPQYIDKNSRPVSAIAPGVLGTTGIETLEVLEGIVSKIKPKLLIVVDSLASRSIERISSSIQISDTGIVPGAGVGNTRKEISVNTLGIPVIAIGIPMVVESAVLVNDCLNIFIERLQNEAKSNDYLNELKQKDNYEEIKESLNPTNYNMIVTPKEIDELIENMKDIIARGINFAVSNN